MEHFFFIIVALVAIVSCILVVTCRNPVNSALSLVLAFFCLATFYVMLDAPFMAATQVIVYAGAIMVLILFVIMLLNLRTEGGNSGWTSLILRRSSSQTWGIASRWNRSLIMADTTERPREDSDSTRLS